ncbi:hypothetical protein KNP414_01807 [Paenibacillus mucilaginosus KNP414]|uniref:Uncharacterized protein n=1 Tax=Paenibacillus mucilaginosus (strain KNP414) TaxID=1036673 RepID=F8FQL4_PAEMK|nr:hypothetical protein KNP414_01807 [Paenibacillus mucilaginosus KNP414]
MLLSFTAKIYVLVMHLWTRTISLKRKNRNLCGAYEYMFLFSDREPP